MTIRWFHSLTFCLCLCGAAMFPVVAMAADATPASPAVVATPQTVPVLPPALKPVPVPVDVTVAFPQEYQAWRDWVAQNPTKKNVTDNKEFKAFYGLGAQAVPLMIAKMQQSPDEAFPLADAVAHITQKVFTADQYPDGNVNNLSEGAKLYVAWWATGRKDIAATFEKFYTDWKAAKKDGENIISMDEVVYDSVTMTVKPIKNSQTPFGDAYYGMKNLGIDILPLIITKVQANDYNLLPLFSELTGGKAHYDPKIEKRVKNVLGWWEKNQDKLTLPAAQ